MTQLRNRRERNEKFPQMTHPIYSASMPLIDSKAHVEHRKFLFRISRCCSVDSFIFNVLFFLGYTQGYRECHGIENEFASLQSTQYAQRSAAYESA